MKPFVHLHVHTEYSLLDGIARIEKLVKVCKEKNMPAVAITDHGNMYGAVALYDACKEMNKKNPGLNLKAIIGTEFYVADDLFLKTGKSKNNHLILLAKNKVGYHNLCKLNTIAFRDGFYYKPRIDHSVIEKYSEGLICLSACLASEVQQLILQNEIEKAEEVVKWYKGVFKDDYYIELQNQNLEEQVEVNRVLKEFAKKYQIKTVATNDVHYISREDAEVQDVLMCVQMGKTINDPNRLKFRTDEFFLKSYDEMAKQFPDDLDALETTLEIADKCTFTFDEENIDKNMYRFPPYKPPDNKTSEEYLRELTEKGIIRRYGGVTDKIRARIESEMNVILKQGFAQYFLTVWDYINAAKNMGVPVGPGRGSGAGSVVAYCIGITDIDPFKFDLLFERFLHTERVTAPDFDVDFADDRRQDVIDYVRDKYGADKVVKIVTFGTMAAKNAIKDVGRVLSVPYSELDKITKNIPNIPAKHHDVIKKCFGFYEAKEGDKDYGVDYAVPDLVEAYNSNPEIKRVVDIAMKLEGAPRQCSTHACGVVIACGDLFEFMPLSRNGDDLTTQYSMTDIERLGHLKMDFLGLRNLNDIQKCIQYVKENHGVEIDFSKSNYDDPGVYKMISTGNTKAVFQIESPGFQKFMRELQPTGIEDIVAGVSLFRPGPMDSIPRYVHNKHNPEDVTFDDPILEPILNVTYGCIVYQEQVMRIVQDMAGYTLGQADMVRRMMGKKKLEAMRKEKEVFLYGKPAENGKPAIEGAIKRGVKKEVAEKIWGEMESFASYAFNKSHAAAYSVVTYETAYLKTYYEPEFLTSLLNNRISNSDELKNYVTYAKTEGIEVLPPDVNLSETYFSVKNDKIRFGLAGLKGVGVGVIDEIINERKKNGNFKSLYDFIDRLDGMCINKRCIESMILSGAFDCFGYKRSQMMRVYSQIIEMVTKDRKFRATGQIGLFDDILKDDKTNEVEYPNIPEYDDHAKLKLEKEVVGVYISGHPLSKYASEFSKFSLTADMLQNGELDSAENVDENGIALEKEESEETEKIGLKDGMEVNCGGIITEIKTLYTKRDNKEMAFVKLEDLYGTIELMLFPKIFAKVKHEIKIDSIVKVHGKLSIRNDEAPIVLCDSISNWTDNYNIPKESIENVEKKEVKTLYLKFDLTNEDLYSNILDILKSYSGESPVIVKCETTNKVYKLNLGVFINNNLKNELLCFVKPDYIVVK